MAPHGAIIMTLQHNENVMEKIILSATPVADEYRAASSSAWPFSHKDCVALNGEDVWVIRHTIDGRQGSYERGFKFTSNTYGILRRKKYKTKAKVNFDIQYSANHGATWHPDIKEAMKSKGKFKLDSSKRGEFAFDSIQKINREYFGPSYAWKP